MRTHLVLAPALAVIVSFAVGCSSSPDTPQSRQTLRTDAKAALDAMAARDPGVRDFVDRAHGYAVFPKVGKGAAVVGGASGRGVVYEKGEIVGYAQLKQASIGLQAGAQTYSELLVFENETALGKLRAGNLTLGAEAAAYALQSGGGREYRYQNGVAIFTLPRSGVMAAAAVSGQKITFNPAEEGEAAGGK
jgi:lipid-binding SYLF domain-containing protein